MKLDHIQCDVCGRVFSSQETTEIKIESRHGHYITDPCVKVDYDICDTCASLFSQYVKERFEAAGEEFKGEE